MRNNSAQIPLFERLYIPLVLLYFFLLFLWWGSIYISGSTDGDANHAFGFIYGGFSIIGAVAGFFTAGLWGGKKSYLGRAVLALSLGLLCQGFGQYSFWVYNYYLHIAVPYPGIPDIGFFGTIICYFYAALQLGKVSGVKYTKETIRAYPYVIVIPIIMLAAAYLLFLNAYEFDLSHPLKSFLDYGYPLGQAMYISIALMVYALSRKLLGGILRSRIVFLLLAFAAQFVCDYVFIYFAADYFPASFIDLFYLISYATMTIAILNIRHTAFLLKK